LGNELVVNLAKNKRYDRILHYPRYKDTFTKAGDVVEFHCGSITPLFPGLTKGQFVYEIRSPAALGAGRHRHRRACAGSDHSELSDR